MALSVSTLKGLIKTNIQVCYGPADDEAKLDCFCQAIADAVVTHITTSAVVTASGPDPQGGTQTVTGTVS